MGGVWVRDYLGAGYTISVYAYHMCSVLFLTACAKSAHMFQKLSYTHFFDFVSN